jgi:hypothetical protein
MIEGNSSCIIVSNELILEIDILTVIPTIWIDK